jgi:hypothetical protein
MTDDTELRDELRLAIEGRRELGDEMEPEVIDACVARIEKRLAERDFQGELALQSKRDSRRR